LKEFALLRESTELLFKSLSTENLITSGLSSNNPTNAAAMGYVAVGHVIHHMKILKERYLAK
jgi:hypothetical protein